MRSSPHSSSANWTSSWRSRRRRSPVRSFPRGSAPFVSFCFHDDTCRIDQHVTCPNLTPGAPGCRLKRSSLIACFVRRRARSGAHQWTASLRRSRRARSARSLGAVRARRSSSGTSAPFILKTWRLPAPALRATKRRGVISSSSTGRFSIEPPTRSIRKAERVNSPIRSMPICLASGIVDRTHQAGFPDNRCSTTFMVAAAWRRGFDPCSLNAMSTASGRIAA